MGALREKMVAEMKLRNFASRTQKSYLAGLSRSSASADTICRSGGCRAVRRTWPSRGYGFSISRFWGGPRSRYSCHRENAPGDCRRC